MPRTLPWLTPVQNRDRPRNIKNESSPQRSSRVKTETPSRVSTPSTKRDFLRSSPSPPSSPIHQCPEEEFLIEGLGNDDLYIMVEDEFYTVAQSFTRHLHYAEYVRRKKEAKVQNAGALEDIVLRPTDGVSSMSEGLKRKYQAEEISARQKAGIEQIEREKRALDESGLDGVDDKDAEEEQHESWAGTSLYDLMFSPRKARLLVGMRGVKSSTRAAAGFAKAGGGRSSSPLEREKREEALPEETTTDDEDDDLDGGGNVSPTVVYRRNGRPSTNSNTSSSSAGALISRSVENREKKLRPTNTERAGLNPVKSERRIIFDDFDELPELRKSNIQLQSQQFTPQPKTKRKHSKDNNTGAKKSRLNEVPTFLI